MKHQILLINDASGTVDSIMEGYLSPTKIMYLYGVNYSAHGLFVQEILMLALWLLCLIDY